MVKSNQTESITWKNLSQLVFDPSNPRVPSSLDTTQDSEVIKWLLRDASIIELMGAIGQNDYFIGEPLLVVPSSSHSGKFEVVEGNRRLCAVKLLSAPELAPIRKRSVQEVADEAMYRPNQLPVVVYEQREDILDYLVFHQASIQE